jgi:glycosyltransferase involved in cell wall biosynthesis
MRIALFSETFLPKIDGVVTRITHTAEQLVHLGHQVLLVVPNSGLDEYHGAAILNLPVVRNPFYPEMPIAAPRRRIFPALDAFRPDVVHVAGPWITGIGGVAYARRRKLPLVASYHTHLPKFLPHMGLAPMVPDVWRWLRGIHSYADINLCTSSVLRDELAAQRFPRLDVWQRAVDAGRFHPSRRSGEMRRRLSGGEPDKPLLLYAGRLSAEKELEQLRPILDRRPDVRLAIVGDGPQRAALERTFAGTPAIFAGYLRGDELTAAFASADLFVFPSRTETLGLVLLEAMASGCPVVAARAGGIVDICTSDAAGRLYTPGDTDDLLRAIETLLPEVRGPEAERVRQACRDEAVQWDWESCTRQLLTFYQQALASPIHRERNRPTTTLANLLAVGGIWLRAAAIGARITLGLSDVGYFGRSRPMRSPE